MQAKCAFASDVNKDWTHKDQDKDKDQSHKDKDKDKDWTHKDKDKDKDLKLVPKESLRTRTRINITASSWIQDSSKNLKVTRKKTKKENEQW